MIHYVNQSDPSSATRKLHPDVASVISDLLRRRKKSAASNRGNIQLTNYKLWVVLILSCRLAFKKD